MNASIRITLSLLIVACLMPTVGAVCLQLRDAGYHRPFIRHGKRHAARSTGSSIKRSANKSK